LHVLLAAGGLQGLVRGVNPTPVIPHPPTDLTEASVSPAVAGRLQGSPSGGSRNNIKTVPLYYVLPLPGQKRRAKRAQASSSFPSLTVPGNVTQTADLMFVTGPVPGPCKPPLRGAPACGGATVVGLGIVKKDHLW